MTAIAIATAIPERIEKRCTENILKSLFDRRLHAARASLLAATAAATDTSDIPAFIRSLSKEDLSLDSAVNRPHRSKLFRLPGLSVHMYVDVKTESL
jgi:hypothetical protein